MSETRDAEKIKGDRDAAIVKYRGAANTDKAYPLSQKVKSLQAELSSVLSKGAVKCKDCGNAPIGMEQQAGLSGRVVTLYEVGCSVCRDRRAQGFSPEEAVNNWNARKFLPPKVA